MVDDDRPCLAGTLRIDQHGGFPPALLLDLQLDEADGTMVATNRYTFSGTADFAGLLDVPRTEVAWALEPDSDEWMLALRNDGDTTVLGLVLSDDRPLATPGWAEAEDSGFDLLPGESRSVRVRWTAAPVDDRRLAFEGWNAGPIRVG